MSGRWWRCPVEAWQDKREKPWTEVCAIAELRWWEDQVRQGQQPKMPTRRFLEERFGWSAHRVDKLRYSTLWLPDSRMENPYLKTTKKRPGSDQSPTKVRPASRAHGIHARLQIRVQIKITTLDLWVKGTSRAREGVAHLSESPHAPSRLATSWSKKWATSLRHTLQ